MSAILAAFGATNQVPDDLVERLLERMAHRGSEATAWSRSNRALLAVARDAWEMDPGFAGPTLVASRGSLRVVCDATLYYVSELQSRLRQRGVIAESASAADLIAAAYQAFGERCVDVLEGDFAFCVWDEAAGTLFCARDPFGSRSLFHTRIRGQILVASTPHALTAFPGMGARFNPEGVLRAVLLRNGDGRVTAWEGVHELPAGHVLRVAAGVVEVRRYWNAGGSEEWRRLSTADAVVALRELLRDAAIERALPGQSALAISGGLDSTSLLASIAHAPERLPALLSFRYLEGDPEDEAWYIERTAQQFDLTVRWVGIDQLGMYDDLERRGALRSNCHGHIFESHNRALAAETRAMAGRVLMNGHGGDNVMAVGNGAMADLLRSGRLLQLHRYRSSRKYRGFKHFVEFCVRPALPLGFFDLLERALGRRICSRPEERTLPSWVVAEKGLVDAVTLADRRDYRDRIVRGRRTVDAQIRAWTIAAAGHLRGCAASFDLNRHEGVELRMPFHDRRLVEFALSRPPEEFNQPFTTKVLLRKAMEGHLPARSRAPGPGGLKPGSAVGVIKARWASETVAAFERMGGQPWISEELGVVDRRRFADLIRSPGGPDWWSAADISLTLFAEAWLRAQRDGHAASEALSLRSADRIVAVHRQ